MICDFISILLDKIMKNTEKSKKSLLFKKKNRFNIGTMGHIPIMQSPKLGVFIVCVPEFNSSMLLLVWFPSDFSPENVWQNLRLIYGIMIWSVYVGGIWCMLLFPSRVCCLFTKVYLFIFVCTRQRKEYQCHQHHNTYN